MWNHMRTHITQFDIDINDLPGDKHTRPENDEGWKVYFPDNIEKKTVAEWPANKKTEKRFKTKKTTKTNPMWQANRNDEDIHKEVWKLIAIMQQSRVKLNTDRQDHNAAVRALVVTSVQWNYGSHHPGRDLSGPACWAVLESYIVKRYRATLLNNTIGGTIRRALTDVYTPHVKQDQAEIGRDGRIIATVSFPWWDMVTLTDSSLTQGEEPMSAEQATQEKALQKITDKDNKDILRLINFVQKLPSAHNNLGPSQTIDTIVASRLDSLVQVFGLRVIIHIG